MVPHQQWFRYTYPPERRQHPDDVCDVQLTKGDNGAAKDLGGAKKVTGKDGSDMYEVELPTAREDVDSV